MIALGTEFYSYSAIKERIKGRITNEKVNNEEKKLFELISKLTIHLKNALESSNDFAISAYNLYDEVFELRIEGLNWLMKEGRSKLEKEIETWTDTLIFNIEKKASNQFIKKESKSLKHDHFHNSIQELMPNLNFAKRTLKKVLLGYFDSEEGKQFLGEINNISVTTYKDYINIIRVSVPFETQKQVLTLVGSSLMLEICLIAVDIVFDPAHAIQLPKNRFNELNNLIVSNAQQYGATAKRMGIIGKKRRQIRKDFPKLSQEELNKEKSLAEQGMSNYFENLSNE